MQSRCKPCFNRMCVVRWRRIKADEVERMGGRCADCGGAFHPDVFEFHHPDPRIREYAWTKLRLFSAERRRRELAKCVMLCANCHRMRHVVAEPAAAYTIDVGAAGFEPTTSCSQSRRATELRYAPKCRMRASGPRR